MPKGSYIWLDGKFINSSEACVPILTHSLQYGSGIFEGLRAYETPKGGVVFRLHDHMHRFLNSAKVYRMNIGFSQEELEKAVVETIRKNRLRSCYIRPFAFYNDQHIGLSVYGKRTSVAIAAVPFGNYFENKDKGIRCSVSSWRRISSDVLPPRAKASGNYLNSILASLDAKESGAEEAILLSSKGYVAEGPGENIFLYSDGRLLTPSGSSDILLGITRDSVIKIAESIGILVDEREVHREELYTADELFFTGTAAELTPITHVDGRKIGEGKAGPITKTISDAFTKITGGENSEFSDWLTEV